MKFWYWSAFIFVLGFSSCSPLKEEAPLQEPAPPVAPVDQSGDNNFKYGQTAKSAGGWSVEYDSADPAEQVVLPSGWVVEVKYE